MENLFFLFVCLVCFLQVILFVETPIQFGKIPSKVEIAQDRSQSLLYFVPHSQASSTRYHHNALKKVGGWMNWVLFRKLVLLEKLAVLTIDLLSHKQFLNVC